MNYSSIVSTLEAYPHRFVWPITARRSKSPVVLWSIPVVILVLSSTGFAQGPPPGAGPPPIANPKLESRDREIREGTLRSAELEAAAEDKGQRRIDTMIVKLKEDFTRIQVLRNQIAHNLVARIPLDYRLVTEQTREINKRANRLKTYMLPHSGQEKEKETVDADLPPADLTGALVRLCKLIDAYVENPALKNATTLNAQELEKAKADKIRADKDLGDLVVLSLRIQKSAEKLNKTPQ